ncbi:MAG: hypothetical protein EOO60_09865 [Hymenobacter sp.]|nr:MAG: hypothetical protein EOO60_09865 [Hymenobacter sp.]
MRSSYYTILLLLLLSSGLVKGQSQASLRKIYAIERTDGTVCIIAENHGSMPFTATIRAELVNMSSNVKLPLRIIVAQGDKPYILATFTPEIPVNHSYKYNFWIQDGIYTGHLPDTSYVYRLPYYPRADTILPRHTSTAYAPWQHLYAFPLPENTAICAARAGTVGAIMQQAKNSSRIIANLVYVLHDDGSYGCYENIRRNSVVCRAGQRVAVGDTLAYFGGNRPNLNFWFAVQYPTDSLVTTAPVNFRVGKRLIRSH